MEISGYLDAISVGGGTPAECRGLDFKEAQMEHGARNCTCSGAGCRSRLGIPGAKERPAGREGVAKKGECGPEASP